MFRVSLLWRCFSALCFLHLVLHFVSSSAIPSTTRSCCHKNAESPADQGHEVVDLFSSVLVSTFNANDMKYITHGDFWLLMRYNLLLTKRNSVRIHILTDSNDLLVRGQEAGFHMHKVEMNNTFYDMYAPNHLSVLGSDAKFVKYEYFNFYRWIKYSEIVNDWNTKNAKDPVLQIKNIVAIDADVMFLLNPHKLFFRVLHSLGYTSSEDNFDMATVAPGAVQVFSATGLNKYGSFIYDWYNRPKQAIAADMDTIAGKVFDHQHFSDMQMGILFSHQNEVARSLCFQYDPALRSVVLLNRSKIDRCMIDKLECVPAHAYSKLEPELSTMKIHDQRVYVGQDEKVAQCFMHFRGDKAKKLMKVFAIYMLTSLARMPKHALPVTTGSTHNATVMHHQHGGHPPAPSWMQRMMNDQILVRGAEDKVFVVRQGVRHWVSSYEVFQKMHLRDTDIIGDVPNVLLRAIPLGPDIFV